MKNKKILVLGLGNTILSDDGVGIYVAREIERIVSDPNMVVEEASIGGLELLDTLTGYRKVILIDAVTTGQHGPGTLFRIQMDELKGGSAVDRHHIGLKEAVDLGFSMKMDLPDDIVIYGIEIEGGREFGEKCTPEIEKRITEIAKEIADEQFL